VRGRVVAGYLRGRRIASDGRIDGDPAGAFVPGPGARA
jgi:hypothetical protein